MRTINNLSEINFEKEIIFMKPEKKSWGNHVYYHVSIIYEKGTSCPFRITIYQNIENFIDNISITESYHQAEEVPMTLSNRDNYSVMVFETEKELENYRNNLKLSRKLVL